MQFLPGLRMMRGRLAMLSTRVTTSKDWLSIGMEKAGRLCLHLLLPVQYSQFCKVSLRSRIVVFGQVAKQSIPRMVTQRIYWWKTGTADSGHLFPVLHPSA